MKVVKVVESVLELLAHCFLELEGDVVEFALKRFSRKREVGRVDQDQS